MKEILLSWAPDLKDDDIQVTSSGAGGEDLKLSPAAREVYPLIWECKNTEKINVWAAYEQACKHARGKDSAPIVAFSKNFADPMIVMKLEDFLRLIR